MKNVYLLMYGLITKTYSYAGIKYANPHAVTQIANGLSTTTFTYDNNGNVTQKTTNGTTTTYRRFLPEGNRHAISVRALSRYRTQGRRQAGRAHGREGLQSLRALR